MSEIDHQKQIDSILKQASDFRINCKAVLTALQATNTQLQAEQEKLVMQIAEWMDKEIEQKLANKTLETTKEELMEICTTRAKRILKLQSAYNLLEKANKTLIECKTSRADFKG